MNATDRVRISIVTPTLNAETYFEDCLRSIEAQQASGLEHFVVDGGSHDRTEAIARQHPYLTWLSRPGLRQSAAINEGLRASSGDVVAWLNADDVYVSGALEFVARQFGENHDLDVLYGDCQVIDASGRPLWVERPGEYDFRRLLRRGNYIAQPAVFLRRRVIDAVGLLDESYDYGMDFELWLRLREQRVGYVPCPLAMFRWHPDSKSATGQMRSWSELLRIVRYHGGGWTPEIAFTYVRFLMTVARSRATQALTGSGPVRPLTRGQSSSARGTR